MAAAHYPGLQTDSGPGIRLLVHIVSGMPQAAAAGLPEALEEFIAGSRGVHAPSIPSRIRLAALS